ncbi:4-vinyl reductase, partial [Bacteroidota bacterium]
MEKYNFKWKDIGDIELGRPNLGKTTYVGVYRLMQYTMRAVLENRYGNDETKKILIDAGRLAGVEFCKNVLDINLNLDEFISQLHSKLLDLKIGILRVEKSDVDNMSFIVTVSEDLDCSGLPLQG